MNTREIAVGLAKKNLVDCIYSSACVDGLNITLQQTQDILQDAKLEGVKANDVLFVINMRDAWRFVLDTLDESVNAMYVHWLNNMCVHSLRYGSGQRGCLTPTLNLLRTNRPCLRTVTWCLPYKR